MWRLFLVSVKRRLLHDSLQVTTFLDSNPYISKNHYLHTQISAYPNEIPVLPEGLRFAVKNLKVLPSWILQKM